MRTVDFCKVYHCVILLCLLTELVQILLNSKLPVDVLGRIWDLSDIDNDGQLDADEFAVVCVDTECYFVKCYVAYMDT